MSRQAVTVKMELDMPAGVTEDQQVMKTRVNPQDCSSEHSSLESLVSTLCSRADNNTATTTSEDGNRKKKKLTAEVLKYLQTLASTCGELRRVGVEAGLMLFEGDSKVWCCGSSRLKHLATHPQMTQVLSEMTSTEDEEQMSLEKWTVVNLLTSSHSRLTLHHYNHHSPSSRSAQSLSFPTLTSSTTNCFSAGEDSEGISNHSLSSFQTLAVTETVSSFTSVTNVGAKRSGKTLAVNEPLTFTCDSENGPLTSTQSIKGEPLTSTCESEGEQTMRFSDEGKCTTLTHASEDDPLTLTCAGEGEGLESVSQEEEEEDMSDDVIVRFDEPSASDSRNGNGKSRKKALHSKKEWQRKMVRYILGKGPLPQKPQYTSKGSKTWGRRSHHSLLGAGADMLSEKQWQEMMVQHILEGIPQEPQPLRTPTPPPLSTPIPAKGVGTTPPSSTDIDTNNTSSPTDISTTTTTPINVPTTIPTIFVLPTINIPTTINSTTDDISSLTTSTPFGNPSIPTMESVNVDVPFSAQSCSLTDSQPCMAGKASCGSSKQWQDMMVSYITDDFPPALDTLPPPPNLDLTSDVADIISSDPDPAHLSSLPDRPANSGSSQLSEQWQQMMVSYITDGCLPAPNIQPREQKQNWCGACKTSFASKPELKRHRLEMHPPGSKPFPCTMCPKRFNCKRLLELHLRRHMGVKPYQCEQCGFRCSEKGNLQVHMRIHSSEKPFSCDICGKRFRVMSALKVHQRWHAGEAPYLCEYCGKGFRQGGRLNEHRRIHSGEAPFACTYCGKAFPTNRLLKIHERIHTGIEPHTCHFCGKAFKLGKHLTIHLRLHTGERPFSCEICRSSFHRSDLLTAHIRRHYPSADKKKSQPSSAHKK